jgi:3-phenylpropionate/trans-cinnamate dioxygenase ferredoxin reductase component
MLDYRYLIIGGGMTADSAVRGIREVDRTGSIGLISAEPHLPYNRPPLTKKLWTGKSIDTIWRGTEKRSVDLRLERKATEIHPAERQVIDDQGETYRYEKLLIATGGKPRRLPFGGADVMYYRTFSNYLALREQADRGSTFAVIGGGFIGSEIAAALAMNHRPVTEIIREEGICAGRFPADLVEFLNRTFAENGVTLKTGAEMSGIEKSGDQTAISLTGGETVRVDSVVAGIGIQPNTDLAQAAGVAIDNGILVDEFCQTNIPGIFAAGDVANFYSSALDRRMRVEHEDNANTMGTVAGENMAGKSTPYHHLPYFYSDLFDLGYEAVGILDARMDVVADWQERFRKGVLYYLSDDRVRGVVLWNVWGKVDAARDVIANARGVSGKDLLGRIT